MLTAKGAATRQRIIEGAADEIRERGAAATTLDDIRQRTATSKSQLFHYFPDGREQLLLAVAAHEADRVLDDQQPYLGTLTTWDAWGAWRDAVIRRYRAQGVRCPLGVLMSEIGRSTPATKILTAELLRRWHEAIRDGVVAMQRTGQIADDLDPAGTAAAVLSAVQGGVAILMTTGDISHLEAGLDVTLDLLKRSAA